MIWLDSVDSTQDEALRRLSEDPASLPHGTALATADQQAGRGRSGRVWTAPRGSALALTLVLRPGELPRPVGHQHWSWVSLVASATLAGELEALGVPTHVKWPNDVLTTDGRKLCGVLAAVGPGDSLVLGMGVNLDHSAGAPVPTATAIADWAPRGQVPEAPELAERLRDAVLRALQDWAAALPEGPEPIDGTAAAVAGVVERISTLGRRVRAELPGGGSFEGEATGLGPGGTLKVTPTTGGRDDDHERMTGREISAADVVHLRGDVHRGGEDSPQRPPGE